MPIASRYTSPNKVAIYLFREWKILKVLTRSIAKYVSGTAAIVRNNN